jgi:CRISPR-associated protein Cas6/Cse3/CasE subtype I-E
MDDNRRRIVSFLAYLKKHAKERGMMADLRHGFSRDTDEYRAWPHIAVRCDLTRSRERAAWVTIGAPIDEHFTRNGKRGKHVSVDFQGILNVTNQDRFKKAFCKGIGSAKAFGFGLLMLQPISSKK